MIIQHNLLHPMFPSKRVDQMLHPMVKRRDYSDVEFTPELIRLLLLGRLKRAYERISL